jgi:hypothetical protein
MCCVLCLQDEVATFEDLVLQYDSGKTLNVKAKLLDKCDLITTTISGGMNSRSSYARV